MSKTKKLAKKFSAFVEQMTANECRKQLVLAYIQMEKCMQVLRGEDVKPVAMKDNGESSELELFYMWKKVAEELSTQEQENGTISMTVISGKGVFMVLNWRNDMACGSDSGRLM